MDRGCLEINDTGTLSTQMEALFLQPYETETLTPDSELSSFQRELLSVRRHLKSYVYTTPNMLATLLMISVPVQGMDNLGPLEVRTHSHVFLQDTQDTTLFRCRSCYTTIQICSAPQEFEGLTDLTWVRLRPRLKWYPGEYSYSGRSEKGDNTYLTIRYLSGSISEHPLNPDATIFYRQIGASPSLRKDELKLKFNSECFTAFRECAIHPLDAHQLWALQCSRISRRFDVDAVRLVRESWKRLTEYYPLPATWEELLQNETVATDDDV